MPSWNRPGFCSPKPLTPTQSEVAPFGTEEQLTGGTVHSALMA